MSALGKQSGSMVVAHMLSMQNGPKFNPWYLQAMKNSCWRPWRIAASLRWQNYPKWFDRIRQLPVKSCISVHWTKHFKEDYLKIRTWRWAILVLQPLLIKGHCVLVPDCLGYWIKALLWAQPFFVLIFFSDDILGAITRYWQFRSQFRSQSLRWTLRWVGLFNLAGLSCLFHWQVLLVASVRNTFLKVWLIMEKSLFKNYITFKSGALYQWGF